MLVILTWKNLSGRTKPSPANYPSSTDKKATCLDSEIKVLNETRVKLTLLIMKPYKTHYKRSKINIWVSSTHSHTQSHNSKKFTSEHESE